MSILESETAAPVAAGPTWTRVESSLWVASTRREFLGSVEQSADRYLACDRFAVEIGTFTDLELAKQQVLHPASTGYLRRTRHAAERSGMRLALATAIVAAAAIVGSATMITMELFS